MGLENVLLLLLGPGAGAGPGVAADFGLVWATDAPAAVTLLATEPTDVRGRATRGTDEAPPGTASGWRVSSARAELPRGP